MAIGDRTVCIQGIVREDGSKLTEEMLLMIFENPRNGGPIQTTTFDETKDLVWITFADSSTAEAVLARKNFEAFGLSLTAVGPETMKTNIPPTAFEEMASVHSVGSHNTPSAPPGLSTDVPPVSTGPTNNNNMLTVVVENIPSDFDEDDLDVLIDNPNQGIEMEGSIISMEIDSKVATVTFSSSTDAQNLIKKEFLEFKNYQMPVKRPVVANPLAVLITGISESVDKAFMEMFFSNRKKSGGDKIAEVKYFEPENGFAVILYAEENVAEAVISKKFHIVRKRKLVAEQWIPGEEKKFRKVTEVPSVSQEPCRPPIEEPTQQHVPMSCTSESDVSECGPEQPPYAQNKRAKQDLGSEQAHPGPQRLYPRLEQAYPRSEQAYQGAEGAHPESGQGYPRSEQAHQSAMDCRRDKEFGSAQDYRSEVDHRSGLQRDGSEEDYRSTQDSRSRYGPGSGQDYELEQAHGSDQGSRSEVHQYHRSERHYGGSEQDYRSMQGSRSRYEHCAAQDSEAARSRSPMYKRQRRDESGRGEEDDRREEKEEGSEEGSEEEEEVQSCTILVEGIPPKTKEETIRRFFQKRSSSGGGSIEKVTSREDGSYIIVFNERSSVDRILKREQLSLDENVITVKELCSPKFEAVLHGPTERRMVYLRGDLEKLSRDGLILYVEDISGADVERVVYGTKEGVALVVFKEAFNYRRLQREANRQPVEDVMLGVGKVMCSKTIQAFSAEPIRPYMLKLYFANTHESGGSGDVSVEPVEKHYHLVHFENAGIAERVAARRHVFDDKELLVSIYYSGLGLIPHGYDTSKPIVKIPTDRIFEIDPVVVKYVKETEEVVIKANDYLRSRYARLDPSHPAANELRIACELQPDIENLRTLIEQWNDEISLAVQAIVTTFDQNSVQCLPKFWKEICTRLQAYKETKDQTVMIVEREEDHAVDVIGPKVKLEEVLNGVKAICQEVQEIEEQVKEEMDVPCGKLGVLVKKGIKETLKEKWPKISVEVNKKDEKLMICGKPAEILKAIRFIQDVLKDIVEHEVAMTGMQLQVISSATGWKYIQALLREKKLIAVIECDTDKVIIIGEKNTTKQVEALLRDEVIESCMDISEDSQLVLQSQEWNQFIKNLLETHQGKVVFHLKAVMTSITIAAITHNHDMFKEELVNFLKARTVRKQFIPAAKGCVKLLRKYSPADLKQIELDFVSFGVQIIPEEKGTDFGFHIKGISEGYEHAVSRVKDLITSVIPDSQPIRQQGLPQFLKSDSSTLILSGVEAENRVIIEVVDTGEKNAQAMALESSVDFTPKMDVLDMVKTERGVQIKVIVGDMTEHGADALVNPANKRLQHAGGLAGALVQKGGTSIQQESDHYIKMNGNLDIGDAMITKAGTLRAKRIIHAVGPHWKGGGQGEEDHLYDCVSKCLELAKKEDLRTIAIPAMGTGVFGVPVDVATETIAEAIYDFLVTEDDDCQLNGIDLVDQNKRNAESFVAALKKKFGTTEKTRRPKTIKRRVSTGKSSPVLPRPSSSSRDSKDDASSLVTKEGVKIKIVEGEIAKQTTNAIVNSIPSNLNLSSGALSNSIMAALDAQNRSIVQAEADRYKKVGYGGVISTGAGNLASQKIYHIVMPQWKNDPATVKLLPDALDQILSECHQAGMTSLAIPAIGTGNLQWPANVVAESFFDAVIRFSSKEIGTNLKTIYFVIYPSDTNSVAGFNGHLVSLGGKSGGSSGRSERKLAPTHGIVEEPGAAGGDWVHVGRPIVPASSLVGELQIKNLKLQVTTGDITQATTDGIVNSSNDRLNLTMGAVSQALARAGGDSFVAECQQVGWVRPDAVVVTGAGKLRCKYVIHFDAQSASWNWKDTIKRCLQIAEKTGMQSLTFPALGTGTMSGNPSRMAMQLMEAVADFANSGFTGLTLVRVVIYQTNMFQTYLSKMEEASSAKLTHWGKFKKFFGIGGADEAKSATVTMYQSSCESASLDIHGFNQEDIDKAYEAIEKLWEDQKEDHTIGGKSDPKLMEIIKKLSEREQKRIEAMGKPHNVKVEVDASRRVAKIRVRGQLKDASVVVASIRRLLHEVEMKEHEKEQAQLLCQYVQWEFEDKPGIFTPYPEEMNGKLEKAHATNQTRVTWMEQLDDNKQKEITLDLKNMYEIDDRKSIKIRRRDLSKGGYSLPDTWSPMNQGDKCIKVILNTTDQEYIDVAKAFQITSQCTITQIERIQNPTLYRRYAVHKTDMEKERPQVQIERMLWHGTHSGVIDKINHVGFNRSFNGANGIVYGKGVYFARDATYSVNYAGANATGQRQMYYASVLTGEFCVGNRNLVEPPAKSAADPNILFDSTVDNVQNPGIYVVYLDTQVYPHYLITFR